jgi:hypothetical protein
MELISTILPARCHQTSNGRLVLGAEETSLWIWRQFSNTHRQANTHNIVPSISAVVIDTIIWDSDCRTVLARF